jgi:hypothetical protein
MPESGQASPHEAYEVFAALRDRLLSRPGDTSAVSLLGQAVSDVLDRDCPDSEVHKVIADLEAARAAIEKNEPYKEGKKLCEKWYLPLTSLLGLLNQHLHNRMVGLAAFNDKSPTLRDRVLAAIDAGALTPNAIGPRVRSPKMIVLQVLTDLWDRCEVELVNKNDDPYESTYCRVRNPRPKSDPAAAIREEYERAGKPETLD